LAIFQVPFLRILRGKFRLKSNENSKSAIIQQTLIIPTKGRNSQLQNPEKRTIDLT